METLEYKTKQRNVQAFFEGELPELAIRPIKWVVYGSFAKKFITNFQRTNNLELVYENQELQIYRVK
jgi:hypothetical protein